MVESTLQSVDKVQALVYERARARDHIPDDVFARLMEVCRAEVLHNGFPKFAQCFGEDLSLFFDDSDTPMEYRTGPRTAATNHLNVHPEAKNICKQCPVKHLCAQEALENTRMHTYATMAGVKLPGVGKRYPALAEALELLAQHEDRSYAVLVPQVNLICAALVTAGLELGYAVVRDDVTEALFLFVAGVVQELAPELIAT